MNIVKHLLPSFLLMVLALPGSSQNRPKFILKAIGVNFGSFGSKTQAPNLKDVENTVVDTAQMNYLHKNFSGYNNQAGGPAGFSTGIKCYFKLADTAGRTDFSHEFILGASYREEYFNDIDYYKYKTATDTTGADIFTNSHYSFGNVISAVDALGEYRFLMHFKRRLNVYLGAGAAIGIPVSSDVSEYKSESQTRVTNPGTPYSYSENIYNDFEFNFVEAKPYFTTYIYAPLGFTFSFWKLKVGLEASLAVKYRQVFEGAYSIFRETGGRFELRYQWVSDKRH